jgi:protein gp37
MRLAATRLAHLPKYEGLAVMREVAVGADLKQRPDGSVETRKRFRKIPKWTGDVQLDISAMFDVLRWSKTRTCFLCDMSDLFYENVPFEFVAAVLGFVLLAPQHRFYVLTKRAQRMHDFFRWLEGQNDDPLTVLLCAAGNESRWNELLCTRAAQLNLGESEPLPLPNLWLGVSAENQETADERIPWLLETPAAVRFVSYEPALGPVDFGEYLDPAAAPCGETSDTIDWIIAGAESGPRARPVDNEWARSVRDQCSAHGAQFFLKQWPSGGAMRCVCDDPHSAGVCSLPLLDGKQHAAYPEATP